MMISVAGRIVSLTVKEDDKEDDEEEASVLCPADSDGGAEADVDVVANEPADGEPSAADIAVEASASGAEESAEEEEVVSNRRHKRTRHASANR